MKKDYQKFIGTEASFQMAVAKYLDYLNVCWCHCPNGGNRNLFEAKRLKAQGVKAGVPDILIFEPRGKNIGLALELKVDHNKPRKTQHEWLMKLALRGWSCHWSNSLDEIKEIIDNYLEQQPLIIN